VLKEQREIERKWWRKRGRERERERVISQYHRLNPSNANLVSTVTPKLTDTTRK